MHRVLPLLALIMALSAAILALNSSNSAQPTAPAVPADWSSNPSPDSNTAANGTDIAVPAELMRASRLALRFADATLEDSVSSRGSVATRTHRTDI